MKSTAQARPLVLSAAQAQGMAAGTKTQHRVAITSRSSYVDGAPAPKLFAELVWDARVYSDPGPSPAGNAGPYFHVPHRNGETVHRVYPRWHRGTVLWVKEPWFSTNLGAAIVAAHLAGPGSRANLPGIRYEGRGDVTPRAAAWMHARLLPRTVARTLLEVVDVRAESVDQVSELDARAEGFVCDLHPAGIDGAPCGCLVSAMRFRQDWRNRNDCAWCWTYDVKVRSA